ncbi:hypothetical protein KIW84_033468 [Lathyrus oleraceus]|uniref:Uncharacterized protein n=1 Tax=Pisum sativum TaxID=3888 RepID=A0A9D5B361_PEA|nr:hypothetical protein KIW84_033468 [Pisum sativum]
MALTSCNEAGQRMSRRKRRTCEHGFDFFCVDVVMSVKMMKLLVRVTVGALTSQLIRYETPLIKFLSLNSSGLQDHESSSNMNIEIGGRKELLAAHLLKYRKYVKNVLWSFRILIKPEELATMPAVAGAFGYIALEYAQTIRVNEKIDVYGFGVVLLELTTGKETNLKTASR